MNINEAKVLYKKAKVAYYEQAPKISDAQFDKLEDWIKARDPEWPELHKTGVRVQKKTEVDLAHPMPSLNKIYPEATDKWLASMAADSYVIMEKLDGSSLQVTYHKGKPVQVVTRGNGLQGGDISFLIPHLQLPSIADTRKLVFRCEALIPQPVFESKWASAFDNARNAVNGILNRMKPHPALKDVHIVVLGVFDSALLPGLIFAKSQKLKVVPYRCKGGRELDAEVLTSVLAARKANSEYSIDGLVLAPVEFKLKYENADKPKGIAAFKVNAEADEVEAKVKKIVWQISGRGRIIPKIQITPVRIDGVEVEFCTAHNAKWMSDRSIGPGAVVKLVRSGGVIPKIVGVVKAGSFSPPAVGYKEEGVHFVVFKGDSATTKRIKVQRVLKFMVTLGIERLAAKTLSRLYDVGLTSVQDYLNIWQSPKLERTCREAGLGARQTEIIVSEIRGVLSKKIMLSKLMTATQIFGVGIGERKLHQIEAAGISMDSLLLMRADATGAALSTVRGFSDKTIKLITDGMPEWVAFHKKAKTQGLLMDGRLPRVRPKTASTGRLSGEVVTFTGYRDAAQEAWVVSQGGEVANFSSKTSILLYVEGGKASTKVEKAQAKGIKVCTFDELKG